MKRALVLVALLPACGMVTVKQEPYPPLVVTAKPPPPPEPKPVKPMRVMLTERSIKITEKIQFEVGKADIKVESNELLDEIAKVLTDNPQIELVSIEGHTDTTGSAKVNRKLSQQRADAVRAYLVGKGIDGKRLEAKGFGPDKPIDTADTDAARETNRRVEFNIVKQGKKAVTK